MKVCGNPVRRLDPFQLTKTTFIFIILLLNNSFCEEQIIELKYKKQPEFIGLLNSNIELTEADKIFLKRKLELCCDTSQKEKGCWGNCGNNCKCQNMEILIP